MNEPQRVDRVGDAGFHVTDSGSVHLVSIAPKGHILEGAERPHGIVVRQNQRGRVTRRLPAGDQLIADFALGQPLHLPTIATEHALQVVG